MAYIFTSGNRRLDYLVKNKAFFSRGICMMVRHDTSQISEAWSHGGVSIFLSLRPFILMYCEA